MKLYANNQTPRGVCKGIGDDEQIHIELKLGNKYLYHIYFTETHLTIFNKVEKLLDIENDRKGKSQKGECNHFLVKDDYGKEYCQECGKYNPLS